MSGVASRQAVFGIALDITDVLRKSAGSGASALIVDGLTRESANADLPCE